MLATSSPTSAPIVPNKRPEAKINAIFFILIPSFLNTILRLSIFIFKIIQSVTKTDDIL